MKVLRLFHCIITALKTYHPNFCGGFCRLIVEYSLFNPRPFGKFYIKVQTENFPFSADFDNQSLKICHKTLVLRQLTNTYTFVTILC